MDMKYHSRFPVFPPKHYTDNDETEEGEVNDGSEPEEVDSVPSPKSSRSLSKPNPLFDCLPNSNYFPKNQQSARYGLDAPKPYVTKHKENFVNLDVDFTSSNSVANSSVQLNIPMSTCHQLQTANKTLQSRGFVSARKALPITPETKSPINMLPQLGGEFQITASHIASTETHQREDDFDGLHDLEKMQLRLQLDEVNVEKTVPPVPSNANSSSMDGGFVGGTILPFISGDASATDSTTVGGETTISVASVWSPAAPPPLAVTGSRKEISQMHSLYHKACRLYDRAVAKVSSTAGGAAKIDFGCLPQPPSIPVMLTKDAVAPVAAVATNAPSSTTAYPASTVEQQQVNAVSTTAVTAATPAATAYPLTTAAVHSPEAYSSAYTSAYRQTMLVMPKPADGGPPPNTPEHTALWRCYLNYYLQYYLQHQPPTVVGQVPATTVASLYPVSAAAPLTVTLPSAATAAVEVDSSSSAKRIRLTTETITAVVGNNTRQQSTVAVANSTKSSEPLATGGSMLSSSTKSPPIKAEVIKATKTLLEPGAASEDGVESSKCVWVSNLPAGVRAVDVKERCTPFGRVQTIKIIGSRKSKTPSIFAYLIMETVEAAARLVEGLQGQLFQEQELKVKRINALPIT